MELSKWNYVGQLDTGNGEDYVVSRLLGGGTSAQLNMGCYYTSDQSDVIGV